MAEKNTLKRMGQIRTGKAWLMVKASMNNGVNIKEYSALAKSLPGVIHINGLGQTLAFMTSKYDKNHYKHLGEQMSSWVLSRLEGKNMGNYDVPERVGQDKILALIQRIMDNTHGDYRLATKEALSFLNVIRNLASGLADGEQQQGRPS